MGGEIDHLTNLTIRGLNREVPQIIFYTLANHKGWGWPCRIFRFRRILRGRWKALCTVRGRGRKSFRGSARGGGEESCASTGR